jgi:hypothetical protein
MQNSPEIKFFVRSEGRWDGFRGRFVGHRFLVFQGRSLPRDGIQDATLRLNRRQQLPYKMPEFGFYFKEIPAFCGFSVRI